MPMPSADPFLARVTAAAQAGGVTCPDKKHANAQLKRANKARVFPDNTCPASRHVQMIGEALLKRQPYPMLTESPEHCAGSILAVVAELYEARSEIKQLRKALPLALAFLDRAAGEGEIVFCDTGAGSPELDSVKLCYEIAGILGIECGEDAWIKLTSLSGRAALEEGGPQSG